MKRIIVFALCLLCACNKKPQENLVNKIEFDPSALKMFVGDQQAIEVKCYPETATNLDQLVISNTRPEVATFQNGLLTALSGGNTQLWARCGSISGILSVKVYDGWFTKGGVKYGVDTVEGYYTGMDTPEGTPKDMELTLTCYETGGDTQNFWFSISYSRLGETIDFLTDMGECMASVQKNNNEDGYTVAYPAEDGTPVIKLADWGDTAARLTKGTLKVEDLGDSTYSVEADFALSNGYTFTASWEGTASMKKE